MDAPLSTAALKREKMGMRKDQAKLFAGVVGEERICESFRYLRTAEAALPAREMMAEIYREFPDPDGNFVEQFQTTAFDARCFELYLFAYFTRSGLAVDRTHPNPDFLVTDQELTVAVEATTSNPSTSGALSKLGKRISDLSEAELRNYLRDELPIRIGSPLYSKLKSKYWELDHCRGLPFVIAIELFHDQEALRFTDEALASYLYGFRQKGKWTSNGRLAVETKPVSAHTLGEKTIPSNFFGQANAEHVSAIIFSNSGTFAKFTRMGYQSGYGCDVVTVIRAGTRANPDPDAMDPTFFSYNLGQPPFVEPWGEGTVVLHNPNCLHPVPKDFFPDAAQGYMENGTFIVETPHWQTFSSTTAVFPIGAIARELRELSRHLGYVSVMAITKDEFEQICGFVVPDSHPIVHEDGWYSDKTGSFLGVVTRDKVDGDWGYVILARDEYFRFRAIYNELSLSSRQNALNELYTKMRELIVRPQRIFPQCDASNSTHDQGTSA